MSKICFSFFKKYAKHDNERAASEQLFAGVLKIGIDTHSLQSRQQHKKNYLDMKQHSGTVQCLWAHSN